MCKTNVLYNLLKPIHFKCNIIHSLNTESVYKWNFKNDVKFLDYVVDQLYICVQKY
jgi:hypothetical protein